MNLTKSLLVECEITVRKLSILTEDEQERLGVYCVLTPMLKGLRSLNDTIESKIIRERK